MIAGENLIYTYTDARRPTITELRVAVETGEIVGFPAPDGAGKSAPRGSSRTIRDVARQATCY